MQEAGVHTDAAVDRNGTKMRKLLAALALGVAMTGLAQADEVWTTDQGEIVYEREIEAGKIAVFKADGITLYIAGLAGVYEDRGRYSGVWVLDENQVPVGEAGCEVAIVRPGTSDQVTSFWGQLEVTFIDSGFPSIWMADIGECFDGFSETIIARPINANGGR